MLSILHIPKWYPTANALYDGIFIQRHIESTQNFVKNYVIFAIARSQNKLFELEQKENELRIFYKKELSGIEFLDRFLKTILYFIALWKGYRFFFQNSKPDLVHVHVLLRTGIFAYFLKLNYKIPYVITEHWTGYLAKNQFNKKTIKKKFYQLIIKNAQKVLPVSEHLKRAMTQDCELSGNYEVIYNVVNDHLFYIDDSAQKSSQPIEIVMVADMVIAHKNYLHILSQIKKLSEIRQDFLINIFGEGPDKELIYQFVEENKLNQFIKFWNYQSPQTIAKVMNQSRFLLLFSNYENLPCCVSEAQFCGLPVLVSNVGGISEMLNSKNGIMLNLEEQHTLYLKMNELLDHCDSYNPKEIQEMAFQKYKYEVVGKQLFTTYQSILK